MTAQGGVQGPLCASNRRGVGSGCRVIQGPSRARGRALTLAQVPALAPAACHGRDGSSGTVPGRGSRGETRRGVRVRGTRGTWGGVVKHTGSAKGVGTPGADPRSGL